MPPVEDLYAGKVRVVDCSAGLKTGYTGDKKSVVPGDEIVTLEFVDIPVGGFLVLATELSGGRRIEQRVDSLATGANHSSKGLNTFGPDFVEPGAGVSLAGVSWKSK